MIAFCSACNPRQSSWRSPEGICFCSLRQPTSRQWASPEGAPLYPVARIRLSMTRTAPTCRRRQVARLATKPVISIKYSSQVGRLIFVDSSFFKERTRVGVFSAFRLLFAALSQSGNLIQPPPVVALEKSRVEPGAENLPGDSLSQKAPAEDQDIGVIMLAAHPGGVKIVAQSRPHSPEAVGDHRHADAGAAD